MSALITALSQISTSTVRSIDWTIGGLPQLISAQKGSFALINSNFMSLRCYEERELESLLQFSCIEIAKSPQTMMQLAALLRNPNVLDRIASRLVTPDRVQKTNIPTIYLPRLQTTIAEMLSKMDPAIKTSLGVYHPIVDIFTYLIGSPLAKAGMLVKGEGTFVVATDAELTPTWDQIKGYALAQLLRNRVEKAPVTDLIRDKQVMGALLLQPLAHSFSNLSGQILGIHDRWGAFDRLGFLVAILTLRLEDDYPEFKDLRSHPEVIAFMNNHTLVELAVRRYEQDVSSKTVLASATISSATFSNQSQGLVTTMTSTEELSVVPLSAFIANTSVAWIGTAERDLAGIVVAPRYTIEGLKVDVSYLDRRLSKGEPALSLVQLEALEPTLSAALKPAQRMVETDAIDFYNVYADAVLTAYEQDNTLEERIVIGFRADETYLKHLAAALASEISYTREGEITYLFSPNVTDYGHLLNESGKTEYLKATRDPALVIAFASTRADAEGLNVMTRASASWKVGAQNVAAGLRDVPFRGYINADGSLGAESILFPDQKNTLDQQDEFSFKFGADEAVIKLSFYELLMNQQTFFSSSERNVVVAHRQPMVSMAVAEFLTTATQLFEACEASSRDAIATAFADYLGDFFENGAVVALVSGIRSMLAHSAVTPQMRRQRSVTLRQVNVSVQLYKDVVMKLLLRCAVIDRPTYETVLNSALYNSSTLNAVLRSKVHAGPNSR